MENVQRRFDTGRDEMAIMEVEELPKQPGDETLGVLPTVSLTVINSVYMLTVLKLWQ